jgi:branched-chain amino acid transport system substrate-binding protein
MNLRRLLTFCTIFLIAALFLAACSSTAEEPATEAPATEEPVVEEAPTEEMATEVPAEEEMAEEEMATEVPAEEEMAEEEMATEVPAEEEMAEEEMAGEFAGTIVLGAAVSETGRFAREGKDTRQGYNTWLDWVNNEYGGIKVGDDRYQVEIVYYDDEGDPDTAASLVERLITEDEVDYLLGPYSSGLTMSTSAIAEKYGIVMVEGNGASESIFERGFSNIFAVLTPAGNYTQSALKSLADLGAESVVIAYEDTAFPTSVGLGAQKWAEEYGLEVLAVETYPLEVADVSAIMTKFRDLDPDVFVGGGHFNDALLFVRAAEELGFTPDAMVITVGPSNPDFVSEVGNSANYIIGPTQWEATMSWEDEYLGTAAEFAERYESLWGEPPTYQAAESTATALALQLAIEQAGSLEMDDVRQALFDLDAVTFYGPINFDETGKNASKPMGAIQIQDGTINVVAPPEAAVAELDYPMPAWEDK